WCGSRPGARRSLTRGLMAGSSSTALKSWRSTARSSRSASACFSTGPRGAPAALHRKGKTVADPQPPFAGLAQEGTARELEDALVEAIEEALSKLSGGQRSDDGAVEEAAYRAIRRTLMDTKGKKPATAVHVVRV